MTFCNFLLFAKVSSAKFFKTSKLWKLISTKFIEYYTLGNFLNYLLKNDQCTTKSRLLTQLSMKVYSSCIQKFWHVLGGFRSFSLLLCLILTRFGCCLDLFGSFFGQFRSPWGLLWIVLSQLMSPLGSFCVT